jgi:hypothetical protein
MSDIPVIDSWALGATSEGVPSLQIFLAIARASPYDKNMNKARTVIDSRSADCNFWGNGKHLSGDVSAYVSPVLTVSTNQAPVYRHSRFIDDRCCSASEFGRGASWSSLN